MQHAGVSVSTSVGIAVTAGEVRVTPASNAWTEFNVTDIDGMVRIVARKGDLTVSDGKDVVALTQGQERRPATSPLARTTGRARMKKEATGRSGSSGGGGIMNSPYATRIGAATISGVTTVVLVKSENPASPTKP